MALHAFESEHFRGVEDQEQYVREWRGRYEQLIGQLGTTGTEVSISRVLERDQDIPPYRFIRHAVHEFIFPPQPVALIEDKSDVVDPNPGYSLHREDRSYRYDKTKVLAHLRLFYEDSDGRVFFKIEDALGTSELPADVSQALDESFTVTEPVINPQA